jgi:methionyl-tRNA synthetase
MQEQKFDLKVVRSELINETQRFVSEKIASNLKCFSNLDQVKPTLYFSRYATEECREILSTLEALPAKVSQHFQDFNFYLGIDLIMDCLRKTNAYIQVNIIDT